MELDEDKFQASMANAQLEKPFDVAALRKLVTDLVPRTQGQRISEFLTFPPMPEFAEAEKAPPPPPAAASDSAEEDFKQVPIPKMKGGQEKFRVNLKPEEMEPQHIPVDYKVPPDKANADEDLSADVDDEPFQVREPARKATPKVEDLEVEEMVEVAEDEPATAISVRSAGTLNAEQLEKIIREQSKEVIESVVWKVVPDLAAQIIERELNRLLKERESHPY